eukprot:TRINITY_DN1512_c0_g1_i1.p1 TRINITY_DN1512_c0_g1~~TRINITY_DN1512_c0_g1_i1.p1  ORF type:complete len:392 (-),score=81.51 TRINITY_DN1512_c0_g1_i1:208-1383(-)
MATRALRRCSPHWNLLLSRARNNVLSGSPLPQIEEGLLPSLCRRVPNAASLHSLATTDNFDAGTRHEFMSILRPTHVFIMEAPSSLSSRFPLLITRSAQSAAQVADAAETDKSTAVDLQVKEERNKSGVEKAHQQGEVVVVSDYWGVTTRKFKREDGSLWPWACFKPSESYYSSVNIDLQKNWRPQKFSDYVAKYLVKAMRFPTDIFFQKRYGCRAMMLETVAAVPGMVAAMLLHLRSLRRFEHAGGWIRALLEEAENERMHLMTFMEVSKPRWYERALVLAVQGVFFNIYFLAYLASPRIAHRIVGYLEEEAIHSYTEFLKELDAGRIENVPAPAIAIDYWRLPKDATLRDVVLVVRADEAHHRDVNHYAASVIDGGKQLKESDAPLDYH